ncbi:hypothetical protein [Candidatus Methanodesulfokora washburnensis]|nr:hypothetical protein [Candidatus Methanodesulfokores washburnensis]
MRPVLATVAVVALICLSLMGIILGFISLEKVKLSPHIYLILSFEVDNSSIALKGYGYGFGSLEHPSVYDEGLRNDLNRRSIWILDFKYSYGDSSCRPKELGRYVYVSNFGDRTNLVFSYGIHSESMNPSPYEGAFHKFVLNEHEEQIRNCSVDNGLLLVNIESPGILFLTECCNLYQDSLNLFSHVRPAQPLAELLIPVSKDGDRLILLYHNTSYITGLKLVYQHKEIYCLEGHCRCYLHLVMEGPRDGEPLFSYRDIAFTSSGAAEARKLSVIMLIVVSFMLLMICFVMLRVIWRKSSRGSALT